MLNKYFKDVVYTAIIILLGFLYFDKDVTVVDKSVKTTLITGSNPIELINTITAPPVYNIVSNDIVLIPTVPKGGEPLPEVVIPKGSLEYEFEDNIIDTIQGQVYDLGTITSTVYSKDSILGRTIEYNLDIPVIETTITETKFDNRIMTGVFINFMDINTQSYESPPFTVGSAGIELLYIRNKVYYGAAFGLGNYDFGINSNKNSILWGVKFGLKPF
tara:strand:+ start:191 stop:841 length:651 start_codon:yes stop_codon:yes gene_type:complete